MRRAGINFSATFTTRDVAVPAQSYDISLPQPPKKGGSRDASVQIAAVQRCSHLILSRPEHGVDFYFFIFEREAKEKARRVESSGAVSFLTLITTFGVVRWPCCWAAIIQRTRNRGARGGERGKKKDTRGKVNKYQPARPVYSSPTL